MNDFISFQSYVLHISTNYVTVHCEWNEWHNGECSKSCGEGSRNKFRTIKVKDQHGGDECLDEDSVFEGESCNVQECPGNNKSSYQ